ncbi:unnamed protein product [Thelazia callipaeda]|uniref:Protein-tyrosine phosphatase n=1 Tax=Thelazia callipaeda TaxID=103827 RepID=A0A0N5D6H0_THECL|nr:unnamed protein product [Thelazia callipaeda]
MTDKQDQDARAVNWKGPESNLVDGVKSGVDNRFDNNRNNDLGNSEAKSGNLVKIGEKEAKPESKTSRRIRSDGNSKVKSDGSLNKYKNKILYTCDESNDNRSREQCKRKIGRFMGRFLRGRNDHRSVTTTSKGTKNIKVEKTKKYTNAPHKICDGKVDKTIDVDESRSNSRGLYSSSSKTAIANDIQNFECRERMMRRKPSDKTVQRLEYFSSEAKSTMRKWLATLSERGVNQLRKDFMELKSFAPPNQEISQFTLHTKLNRYRDVKCYDSSRVILTWPKENTNDFIHANWVKHDMLSNVFICTQAPMDNTTNDFWRMIWQENVRYIIMLCKCIEKKREKCFAYWPQLAGQSYQLQKMDVTTMSVNESDSNVVVSRIILQSGAEKRCIVHRQWRTWPDRGVPLTSMIPFRLLQYARQDKHHPTVVHCSAGIGRTGTLVMIEILLGALRRGLEPDSKQFLKDLRTQRAQSVQVESQYIYAHYAVVRILSIKKILRLQDAASNYLDKLRDTARTAKSEARHRRSSNVITCSETNESEVAGNRDKAVHESEEKILTCEFTENSRKKEGDSKTKKSTEQEVAQNGTGKQKDHFHEEERYRWNPSDPLAHEKSLFTSTNGEMIVEMHNNEEKTFHTQETGKKISTSRAECSASQESLTHVANDENEIESEVDLERQEYLEYLNQLKQDEQHEQEQDHLLHQQSTSEQRFVKSCYYGQP